jgi:putative transposase
MSSLIGEKKMKKIDYHPPLYKDNLYHIYNRGNGKETIFYNPGNYNYFLRQYDKYISGLADTFAFCLLPNHFHLLVRIKCDFPEAVSESFRKLFISYSMSINKQQNRTGNLFQRGFKRKLIEDEKYFYRAVYYIHSNPVHHGIVSNLNNYKYSSFGLLSGEKETKLCRSEVMEWFGGKNRFLELHSNLSSNFSDNYVIEDE